MYNNNIDRKETKSMITENNKRLEFENLQDAMKTAKTLLKNGYQVYMNIEDDLGDGKIIVVIEYEWVDEDLADGHYIYQTFEDEARIEAEIRQKKFEQTADEYAEDYYDRNKNKVYKDGYDDGFDAGVDDGYDKGYQAGYERRTEEETADDYDE